MERLATRRNIVSSNKESKMVANSAAMKEHGLYKHTKHLAEALHDIDGAFKELQWLQRWQRSVWARVSILSKT